MNERRSQPQIHNNITNTNTLPVNPAGRQPARYRGPARWPRGRSAVGYG